MQLMNIKANTSENGQSGSCTNLSIPARQKLLAMFLNLHDGNLTDSQVQLLTNHIMAYHDIFTLQDYERGEVDEVTHTIRRTIYQSTNHYVKFRLFNAKKCWS